MEGHHAQPAPPMTSTPRKKSKAYICDECGKSIKGEKPNLLRHLFLVHGTGCGGKHQCTLCDKSFYEEREMVSHRNQHHGNIKPFRCDQCDKSFAGPRSLARHKCNQVKAYPCPTCGKTFGNKGHLKDHEPTHDPTPSFKCSKCLRPFKHRQSLVRHERKCTGTK